MQVYTKQVYCTGCPKKAFDGPLRAPGVRQDQRQDQRQKLGEFEKFRKYPQIDH